MSWSVSVNEEAKHAHGKYEGEINRQLHARNGFEQTAMKATLPVVETLAKHAALTPYRVSISASGHINEDGIGQTTISVAVFAPVQAAPAAEVTE